MATSLSVVPQPLPNEMDYAWRRWKLETTPSTVRYRDLPVVSGGIFDEARYVVTALRSLEQGQFWEAAQLADAFGYDDRMGGVIDTRVDALSSLPLSITARPGVSAARAVDAVTNNWTRWFSRQEVKKLHRWGLLLGIGIAELIWDTSDAGMWQPRLKAWDPRYLYWRWDTRSFWLITADGQVEVAPGDGHWVLYAPHGYARGWMQGLIRNLAFLYLTRRWAWRDWNRHSEVHGMPIRKAKVPANADIKIKEQFINDLRRMASEGILETPVDSEGNAFDLELVQASTNGWECFSRLIDKVDECLSVCLLGGNLSTSAKSGGSYALGDVQDRIRSDRLESDALSVGECLTVQAVEPWAWYNYGDREKAPLCGWSTKAPDDRDKTASTWLKVGDGVTKLQGAGFKPDLDEVARRNQIPLLPEKVEPKASDAAPIRDVQSLALNGAQIDSLVGVIAAVADGTMPKDTAVQVLLVAFPSNIDEQKARQIVDPIEVVKAEPESGSTPGESSEQEKGDDDEQPEDVGGGGNPED